MTNDRLFIFTESYPYSSSMEAPFIENEIVHLARHFKNITIIPKSTKGERLSVPEGVHVEEDFSRSLSARHLPLDFLLYSMFSPSLHAEILNAPSILKSPPHISRLMTFIGNAGCARDWFGRYVSSRSNGPSNSICYTYWLTPETYGLCQLKRRHPSLKVVSRAHGYDLYDERLSPPYHPLRKKLLDELDRLYLISDHGLRYIQSKFPQHTDIYSVKRLGVDIPEGISPVSPDNTLRIVSCSSMTPVKRLDRIIHALGRLAGERPGLETEWTHIGSGEIEGEIKEMASGLPASVKVNFTGGISHESVLEFYSRNPVDIFINTSESEGIPVSIMEAMAHGIPVIAPAVGGIPEIVSASGGILLGEEMSVAEVMQAIMKISEMPGEVIQDLRLSANRTCRRLFDAGINFEDFARDLESLS